MYHSLEGVTDEQLDREIRRIKGSIVSYSDYLERMLKEQRKRLGFGVKEKKAAG